MLVTVRLLAAAVLSMLLACCPLAAAKALLVLVSSTDMETSHSTFLSDLRDSGFSTSVAKISSSKIKLQSWGRWLYDGVVILSQGDAELGGALDSSYLVELVDSGRGLFIAADQDASTSIRAALAELGTDLLAPGTRVQDYIAHSQEHGPAALLTSSAHVPAVTGSLDAPIMYRGGGATLAPNATQTMPVLTPAATAVAGSGAKALPGTAVALATAMQTRTNARVLYTGSVDALSDAFFEAKVPSGRTGNRAFAREAAKWAFQERAALHLSNFRHARRGEDAPPPESTYTMRDELRISLDLHERVGGHWVPHITEDLQAQFVMLHPYIRQRMAHAGEGHYVLDVRAPDKYGVYKWVIDYAAPGYSRVQWSEVTPVRPLAHNQEPRFLRQAYPWYAALMTVSSGFFVTVVLVMYHK